MCIWSIAVYTLIRLISGEGRFDPVQQWGDPIMSELPTCTITFLFTDIEGSTIRWERSPEQMSLALARHDEILRSSLESWGGAIFKTVGDAFYATFATAGAAISAAVAAQRTLAAETWHDSVGPLRVRMAIYTGEVEHRGHDYFGQPLNRIARILSTGYGGQVLLSLTTVELVRDMLPADVSLQNLGKHRLKDIQIPEEIFQLNIEGLSANFPPLKTLDSHPNNLPTQLSSFIGREKDLQAIEALLRREEVRLVTLIGPGGIGKTRLGLQVAADVADEFPEGVYFVDLTTIHEREEVLFALAQAIALPGAGNQPGLESIKAHLRGNVLLFIDNFEQVIEAAPLIYDILVSCQRLKVLVTSRSKLHLGGEYEYHLAPLTTPDSKHLPDLAALARYEAIALFIEHARAAKPDFLLNGANAAAIAEICVQLDGLPLAIELAAARVNILPPQTMLKRLGRSLHLLTGGKRDRTARQQTLRNTIAWSYNLLDTHEKTLLCQLAIFGTGSTLEAIEAVCQFSDSWEGDLFDLLRSLVDKSLLRLKEQEHTEPRFEMLHTVREFTLEQLTAEAMEDLKQRHAKYYLDQVEQIGPPPVGATQKHWLVRLEAEYENIKDALNWYKEHGQITSGLHITEALWHFWWLRGLQQEARQCFEKLLEQNGTEVTLETRVKALERISELACNQQDYVYATQLAEEAVSISQQLGDTELIARAYIALAAVATGQHNYQRAINLLQESLKLRQASGNVRGIASLFNNLGNVLCQQGNLDEAAAFHEKSLKLFRSIGDEMAMAAVVNNLAEVEWQREHHKQAEILYEESLKLCRKLGYIWGVASSLLGLGNVARYCNNYQQAQKMYGESLSIFQKLENNSGVTACLEGLAEVIYAQNRLELATRILAQVEVIGYGAVTDEAEQNKPLQDSIVKKLRTALGESAFDAWRTAGHASMLEQVITEALEDFLESETER
jgi:predicted ATPase/class 3 adenylate cyclase/Tfp pilus assembly protein PilF